MRVCCGFFLFSWDDAFSCLSFSLSLFLIDLYISTKSSYNLSLSNIIDIHLLCLDSELEPFLADGGDLVSVVSGQGIWREL